MNHERTAVYREPKSNLPRGQEQRPPLPERPLSLCGAERTGTPRRAPDGVYWPGGFGRVVVGAGRVALGAVGVTGRVVEAAGLAAGAAWAGTPDAAL